MTERSSLLRHDREAPEPASSVPIPPQRLLHDWKTVRERACAYLEALGIDAAERSRLALQAIEQAVTEPVWEEGEDALARTLAILRERLVREQPAGRLDHRTGSPDGFFSWRFERALAGASSPEVAAGAARLRWRGFFSSMPELVRRSMVANRFVRRGWRYAIVRASRGSAESGAPSRGHLRRLRRSWRWPRVALRRRLFLTVLVLVPSVIASQFMIEVLPHQGRTWLEVAIAVFFGALFGWISIGFWTAVLGFFTLIGRKDRFAITSGLEREPLDIDPQVRTAIVMPVCEEPVDRIIAGLKAIYSSLERIGAGHHFDFFILSDTADPGLWVKEEEAWFDWCREVGAFGQIHYRRRRARVARKSGNVADFCCRWGKAYRYMIMLDADSVMAGETLVRLVQLMEKHPTAGMIQTAPVAVNRRSLFARTQQFASRLYGPMFAAGLHYWQLGDGQYWGHNAIIRIAPFMAHCALPRLPGEPPLGGEILSHDFVEAALMGRAGWGMWLAFDLSGSYEETPSTLLEEMSRDRRWCQGNLQHIRLAFTRGLIGAHRALFLNGALSYVSALLWFGFLTLSTAEAVHEAVRDPVYFPSGPSLFPEWPVWRPDWAFALAAVTAAILFLPKLLGIALVLFKWRNTRLFGGFPKLLLSVLVEIVLSALLAPIRMTFHTRFVVANLLGRTVSWRSQTREDAETPWTEALRRHGLDTIVATVWGLGVFWLSPHYFWWLTPIIGALILSVPVSVLASRIRVGDGARRRGIFLIPEEYSPPPELRDLEAELRTARQKCAGYPPAEQDGFVRAIVDPYVNALHCVLLGRSRRLKTSIRVGREELRQRALDLGPSALSGAERRALLYDPDITTKLHDQVWQLPHERASRWGRPATAAADGTSQ